MLCCKHSSLSITAIAVLQSEYLSCRLFIVVDLISVKHSSQLIESDLCDIKSKKSFYWYLNMKRTSIIINLLWNFYRQQENLLLSSRLFFAHEAIARIMLTQISYVTTMHFIIFSFQLIESKNCCLTRLRKKSSLILPDLIIFLGGSPPIAYQTRF